MLAYTLLIIMILGYALYEESQKQIVKINCLNCRTSVDRRVDLYLGIIFAYIFILIAFRGDFASDYVNYEKHFGYARNMSWGELFTSGYKVGGNGGVEIGFYVLMKFIGMFTDNPIWMFTIVAAITLFSSYQSIKNEAETKWLSLILFIVFGSFINSFNIIRAILVYSILFSQRHFLYESKYGRYFIVISVCFLFHLSAIFAMVFIFLALLRMSNKVFITLSVPISIVVFFMSDRLIALADRLLYGNFFSQVYKHGIRTAGMGVVVAPLLFGILIVICAFVGKKGDKRYQLLMRISVLWILLRVLEVQFIEMRRIADMLSFYSVLFFPSMINGLPMNKKDKNIIKVIIGFAAIFLFYYNMKDSPYNPYYFITER